MKKKPKADVWKSKKGGAQQKFLRALLLAGGTCSYSSACQIVDLVKYPKDRGVLYADAFLARLVDCGYVSLLASENGAAKCKISAVGVKKVLFVWPRLIRKIPVDFKISLDNEVSARVGSTIRLPEPEEWMVEP